MAFLKIPFLHLVGNLKIGRTEAERALQGLSSPGLWAELSPFFKLLAQKAYDLVLLAREPTVAETSDELIEGFKTHGKELSLRQWWLVVVNLPSRLLFSFLGAAIVVTVLTFVFGIGKAFYEREKAREFPESVTIESVIADHAKLPRGARLLAEALPPVPGNAKSKSVVVAVACKRFDSDILPFIVEVSHPDRPIGEAIALAQEEGSGDRPVVLIPSQRDQRRYRLMVPELESGTIKRYLR